MLLLLVSGQDSVKRVVRRGCEFVEGGDCLSVPPVA